MYSGIVLFLIYLACGLASAFVFDILYLIQLIFKNKQLVIIVCDIVSTLVLGCVAIVLNTTLNMGIVRGHLVLSFIFGATIERKTLGKLFAKYLKKLYNWLVKVINHAKKSKAYSTLFK